MKGLEMKMEGDKVTLTFDVSEEIGPSKSGKTILVATTEGNQNFVTPDGTQFTLGLNAYVKP